jgi:hypothetical protein
MSTLVKFLKSWLNAIYPMHTNDFCVLAQGCLGGLYTTIIFSYYTQKTYFGYSRESSEDAYNRAQRRLQWHELRKVAA